MSENMTELRRIEQLILANGRVDTDELELLRTTLYSGGKINREAADFLVELHKRVERANPAWEHFFYRAIKDHMLADGKIGVEETAWLKRMFFADGKFQDEERKFLSELKGEAKHFSQAFDILVHESMKLPPEQRTNG